MGELDAVKLRLRAAGTAAVTALAHEVVRGAAQHLATGPAEGGHLEDQGEVEVKETPRGATARITYPGPYARRLHEGRTGNAHFLEGPLKQASTRLPAALAAAARKAL